MRVVVLAVLVTLATGACGLPMPFGRSGSARPEPREPAARASAVATPNAAAAAAVAAWQRGDRAALDRLSTATAGDDLQKRPFPSPPPVLVDCDHQEIPGVQACLFSNGTLNFTLFVQRNQDAPGWTVSRVRFLA